MPPWTSSVLAFVALLSVAGAAGATASPAPAWLHAADAAKPVGPDELAVRWLGTAGFEIRTAKATVLIDPHFSRHNLWKLLSGPLLPDLDRIRRDMPAHAQAVFVGHSHHDHLVDAPTVARLAGAHFYGSGDSVRIAREEGLPPGQVTGLTGGETIRIGDLAVEAVPSAHSDIITNLLVSGAISPASHPPMRFTQYKHGPVFTYVIHWRGRTVYHFGSAEIVEAAMRHRRADVVLLCLSGWKDNPTIFQRVEATLHPRVVIPMHHDDFFRPLAEGFHPGQLAFVSEAYPAIQRDMPESALVPLDFFGEVRLTPQETP